jgi:formiminoglutamase
MAEFESPDKKLFFSKHDPLDPRLGERAMDPSAEAEVQIVGYPDDEGVRLNGGRVGARLGPDGIREFLYRTTPHPRRQLKRFHDAGNLNPTRPLVERHEKSRERVRGWLKQGQQVLALGGGNDYAYADGMGFLDAFGEQKPLILNIDAHLDVRDTGHGLNSGTPFYRLLESGVGFDFVEFGIQTQCNAKAHWDYVLEKGGKIVSMEEIAGSGRSLKDFASETLGELILRRRPAYLAIDIDAFAWPFAAGSSAAWPLGLEPQAFWPFYEMLLKRLDVRVLGIYEVAPGLEAGPGTVKLAAQFAHGFLHHV